MRRTFKEQCIAYLFGMLGFYVGLFGSSFVFSMLGLMAFSSAISWLLSFIVGIAASTVVLVRFEAENGAARQVCNKILDSDNRKELFALRSLIKQTSIFLDLGSLPLVSIPYMLIGSMVFDFFVVFEIVPLVFFTELILRLPSICITRLVWKKEHIVKK